MLDTSASLLERLRLGSDPNGWARLVDLYSPWILRWVRRYDVQAHDADDLAQEVFSELIRELPRFHYDRKQGLFRSWLRTITVNRLRVFWRTKKPVPIGVAGDDSALGNRLDQLADSGSELSQLWNKEHDEYLSQRLMTLIEPEFEPTTWKAFLRVVRDGVEPSAVATELGMTRGAVYTAKCRILQRMRSELAGLVD